MYIYFYKLKDTTSFIFMSCFLAVNYSQLKQFCCKFKPCQYFEEVKP